MSVHLYTSSYQDLIFFLVGWGGGGGVCENYDLFLILQKTVTLFLALFRHTTRVACH